MLYTEIYFIYNTLRQLLLLPSSGKCNVPPTVLRSLGRPADHSHSRTSKSKNKRLLFLPEDGSETSLQRTAQFFKMNTSDNGQYPVLEHPDYSHKIRELITFWVHSPKTFVSRYMARFLIFFFRLFLLSFKNRLINVFSFLRNLYKYHKFLLPTLNCNSKRNLIKLFRILPRHYV
jgi:hypothetical protein